MTTTSEDRNFGIKFLQDILDWIRDNIDLEDRADVPELEDWAEQNGYVLED